MFRILIYKNRDWQELFELSLIKEVNETLDYLIIQQHMNSMFRVDIDDKVLTWVSGDYKLNWFKDNYEHLINNLEKYSYKEDYDAKRHFKKMEKRRK